jgi:hypothetical protein
MVMGSSYCVVCSSYPKIPKLLIRKIYYVLVLIPIFVVQVTKLVQFTWYNTFSKIPPSTSMHSAACVRTWRVARLHSVYYNIVQRNSALSETVRNRTHVHIHIFA